MKNAKVNARQNTSIALQVALNQTALWNVEGLLAAVSMVNIDTCINSVNHSYSRLSMPCELS